MLKRIESSVPWLASAGVLVTLNGLGWDAFLHHANPHLADEESLFSLSNPGHALLFIGLAISVASLFLFVAGRYLSSPRRPPREQIAFALIALGIALNVLTIFSLALLT